MGKIKKILENELIGGTQATDVYPVTSVKAVYGEDNRRLDNIIKDLEANIGIEYADFSSTESYVVGDVVMYEGRLKRFIKAHAAGEWIEADVEPWSKEKERLEGESALHELLTKETLERANADAELSQAINEELNRLENRLATTEAVTEEFSRLLPGLMAPEQYIAPEKIKGAVTNHAIGAIPTGTNVSDLDGKTFNQIISMMLVVPEWPDVPKHEVRFDTIDTAVIKLGSQIKVPRFSAIWNPSIVAVGGAPDATVYCRYQMTTPSGISKYAITGNNSLLEGEAFWEDTIIGDSAGKYIFSLYITHGTGEATLESTNIDIEKTVLINSEEKVMEQTIEVTYPWYINDQEQSLVPLGESRTVVESYEKSPCIRVPFPSSIISVKADIGSGFLPVANWVSTIEMDEEYGIPYKVYYGEDSFNEPVKHEITINLDS